MKLARPDTFPVTRRVLGPWHLAAGRTAKGVKVRSLTLVVRRALFQVCFVGRQLHLAVSGDSGQHVVMLAAGWPWESWNVRIGMDGARCGLGLFALSISVRDSSPLLRHIQLVPGVQ